MTTAKFKPSQDLNAWVSMLHGLYGPTQNYSKTAYEIHTHLTEVCGVFGKHLFKNPDAEAAADFLAKLFAWGAALLKSMHPDQTDLEGIILRKFPGVCPYCGKCPCVCWKGEKPTLDPNDVRAKYFQNAPALRRSVNDFQLMFRNIYGTTWGRQEPGPDALQNRLRQPFVRMVEELAEIAEAMRFYHLYPQNFQNEVADFFAWWFSLVSCFPSGEGDDTLLAEQLLWRAYPGHCPSCDQFPCFCRPGPVRELMSKPPPGQDHKFDVLTALYNQGAYKEDVERIAAGEMPGAFPASCVCVDIDDFKTVNDGHGHAAGDAALRHVASVLRAKVRERDRVYRISGDEFGVLLMDTTAEEAAGMMKRVCKDLREKAVRWVSSKGDVVQFQVSASIGVAECDAKPSIGQAFENADKASYASKTAGKARVTIHKEPEGE